MRRSDMSNPRGLGRKGAKAEEQLAGKVEGGKQDRVPLCNQRQPQM